MGSTFVHIHAKGFWMRDGALELWLRLLALHIQEPGERDMRTREIRDGWLLASRGYFGGHVPVALDEAVHDADGRRIVVVAVHALMDALKSGPKKLDRGTLNVLGIKGEYCADYDTSALLEVGQAFLDLIDGKIQSSAADTSFMPGNL